jgi:uncharacterized phage protein gp47/JayE
MPNQLTQTGIQVATVSEMIATLQAGLQSIYGSDINLDPNTPDGQLIALFVQAQVDQLQLLVNLYNSFNPDAASGVVLDQRVALNGIQRKGGKFSFINITIITDRAITLTGLDLNAALTTGTGFTVSDNAGTNWILVNTIAISGAGSWTYEFRSQNLGPIQATPGTITTIVDVTLGVISVTNASTQFVTGLDEETDLQLKFRRMQSFKLQSVSPADAVQAALLNCSDITDALVVENTIASPVNGVAVHSLWIIVEGGTPTEIATVIYTKKGLGCGLQGAQSVIINRTNGIPVTIVYDVPIYTPLYIKVKLVAKQSGVTYDTANDAILLAAALSFTLNQTANINDVVIAMQTIEPTAICTSVFVSPDGSTWTETLAPTDYQHKFSIVNTNIAITQ